VNRSNNPRPDHRRARTGSSCSGGYCLLTFQIVRTLCLIAAKAAGVDANGLAAWTNVCRVILNLHETITRY